MLFRSQQSAEFNDWIVLLRELDCAVIERIHQYNREYNLRPYDSVRGVFIEGNPVYDNSEINGRRRFWNVCFIKRE